MQVAHDDLATLLSIQQLDLDAMRVSKQLSALPQRKAILDARAKRRTIEAKAAQVAEMRATVEGKIAKVSEEDARLAEKQREVQAAIDAAGGDYRDVNARTKELGGHAKRRATLEADLDALGEEMSKIEGVEAQIKDALDALDAKERAATEVFVKEGGALKQQAARFESERDRLAKTLPDEVWEAYEKTAAKTGGVALARLKDGACGACRAPIDHGRIVDMRARGTLGTCPHCGRLLVLE